MLLLFAGFNTVSLGSEKSINLQNTEFNTELPDLVIQEFNIIIENLSNRGFKRCKPSLVKSLDFKEFNSTSEINAEYLRLAKLHRWKGWRTAGKIKKGDSRITKTIEREGFSTAIIKKAHHFLYVPKMKDLNDLYSAGIWAHEMAHAYCGEWHDPSEFLH